MTAQLDRTRLRYLSADHVEGPRSTFERFEVRNVDDEKIGRLDGVLVDPPARRMRYLVVDVGTFRHRLHLVPLEATRVDHDAHALRVDMERDDMASAPPFDPHTVVRFSDEDLLTAMFHTDEP